MSHIHYKFSSKLSYDTVLFDGPDITLSDLKRQIMGRVKLRAGDCDLQITNAQTKEEYTDDEGHIPKGSSVIIRRVPVIGVKSGSSSKNQNNERSDNQYHQAFGAVKVTDDHNSSRDLPFFAKMANLAHVDASEDDKIKAMMNQSAYHSMGYTKKFGAALPANYICYRCGNTGHHIRNCPNRAIRDNNFEAPMRIKKSTGIPRSFMVEVDDPNIKGAMLTNCGRYAIPTIDAEAYNIGKKEKPPFVPQEKPKSEAEDDPVPDELVCLICHDLLSDAVLIPCCGNSYCDDCIRNALLDSEEHVCPTCSQSDVSPDTLTANNFLRRTVNDYKKEKIQTDSLRGMSATSQSLNPTPMPSSVPTPPLIATQSQPQELHQSTHSQQSADTLPLSQVLEAPPAASTSSLQPVQSHLEIPDKEAEGKTHDDSVSAAAAAAAPLPVLVSNKEPTTAPSQLIPLINHSPVADQSPSVSINPPQSSSGPAPRRSRRSTRWDSPSSTSGCPTRESNTQQIPPLLSSSTSYSAAPPPPLSPSPHFHMFLSAQQPPQWFSHLDTQLPRPSGAPTPILCPSTSSIPALIPKEWLMHQRKKKDRSPHRGSPHRRSSSRSRSKTSKSKSSRDYSRSSSRSRSRSLSRSQGRSRPRSPYSRTRDHHSRSNSSRSYSYSYKRLRSPTSSSSHRRQGKSTDRSGGRSPPSQSSSDSWSPPSQSTSINISLKRMKEKNEKQEPSLQSIAKNSKGGAEKTATGEEEKFDRGDTEITVNERKVPIGEQEGVLEAKIKPDKKKARQMWGKAAFRDDKGAMWKKNGREGEDVREEMEDGEEEDWQCTFRGARRGDGTEVSKREFVTGTQTPPGVYKPEEELMEGESKSRRSRNETHHSQMNTTVEEGSSTSSVGSCGGEECLDRKRVVRTLEEYTQYTAEGRKEKLLLIQVPRSKWEMEESTEEERSKETSKFKPSLFR
ncbi:hypothetical protein PAMA_009268 [Pampus argenteus]